jgi:hypothetical protein
VIEPRDVREYRVKQEISVLDHLCIAGADATHLASHNRKPEVRSRTSTSFGTPVLQFGAAAVVSSARVPTQTLHISMLRQQPCSATLRAVGDLWDAERREADASGGCESSRIASR